jgi:hypothetical protein
MSISVRKDKRANGKEYYKLYEVKRVNGEVETKYIGYLGKSPDLTPLVLDTNSLIV